MENVRFEERRGVDGGDPGKLAYLHNADWQPKPFVAGFKVNEAQCPGCLFPDAKPGKWPHVPDSRCDVWRGSCCCSHPMHLHAGTYGRCGKPGCDCFNFCDCHVIAEEMRQQ